MDLTTSPASSAIASRLGAHPRPFVCELVVEPAHLSDVIDHVSNIEIVRWVDRAAELHGDAAGLPRSTLLSRGLMWFVARHEIDFLKEAKLGDHVQVATWIGDVRRVKLWRHTSIVRAADGEVICSAATMWVLVNLATRRPERIPADWVAALDPLPASSSEIASP
jgi:acyl-CoA thioester hydrolase